MTVTVSQGIPACAGDTNTGSGGHTSPAAPTIKTAAPPRATFSMAPMLLWDGNVIFNLSG